MTGFKIGVGIHDITGPIADCGMMGYSMPDQRTKGLHTRLRSRAFIIEKDSKRVVIVNAECGMIFQGVSLEVLDMLKKEYGNLYTEENVVLTGTHTHSAPGGFSHYALYNLSNLAYDEQNFNTICSGIYWSIVKAHNNMKPGRIKIASTRIDKPANQQDDYCFNRSIQGYHQNPEDERKGQDETNRTMTLLRFESEDGKQELGMINWLAVHATNIGNKNLLVSSDNKGYASYLFEKDKKTDYLADNTFIAAFANCDCADVSPNVKGYPDPKTYFQYMQENGQLQYGFAKNLYDNAATLLDGDIDYRHRYVDMSSVQIDPAWISEADIKANPAGFDFATYIAAIGASKLAGATADGKGLGMVKEGLIYGVNCNITTDPALQPFHKEKPIAVPTGNMNPYPWTPQVLPLQIVRIGKLGLIVTPFECSTMSGRRLRKVVKDQLPDLEYLVTAAYANAYTCYVTTREEYSAQRYEGASTHFGPFTLNAYQQEYQKLAIAMKNGQPVTSTVTPENMKDKQVMKYHGYTEYYLNKDKMGQVKTKPDKSYAKDNTVKVVFWGAHPRNNMKIQDTYLKVDKKENGLWKTIANDWDPETVLRWRQRPGAESEITVEWNIPGNTEPGTYRIRHFGSYRGWNNMIDYSGETPGFTVN
jgi:neutral ceramidase